MKFTGEHIGSRFRPGTIKTTYSPALVIHNSIRLLDRATRKYNEQLELLINERKNMKLLTQESNYGEGRGRSAVESTLDLENLLIATDTDTVDDAIHALIALGSPFVLAERGEDWNGTIAGAKTLLDEAAELASDDEVTYVASFRTVPKDEPNRKNMIKFTFRAQA